MIAIELPCMLFSSSKLARVKLDWGEAAATDSQAEASIIFILSSVKSAIRAA